MLDPLLAAVERLRAIVGAHDRQALLMADLLEAIDGALIYDDGSVRAAAAALASHLTEGSGNG